jgi:hypothetical protein
MICLYLFLLFIQNLIFGLQLGRDELKQIVLHHTHCLQLVFYEISSIT